MKSLQALFTLFTFLLLYTSCTKKETAVKTDTWKLISITGSSETIREIKIPGYNSKQIYIYNFISQKEEGSFHIGEDVFSGKKINYSYSFSGNLKDYVNSVLAEELNSTSGGVIEPESKVSRYKTHTTDSILFTEGTFIKTPLPENSQTAPTACKYKIENNKMTITTTSNYKDISTPNGYPEIVTIKATSTVILEKQ